MTYASANRRPNPAALAGALGIPGAFGALLVVGLAVTVVTVPSKPNPEAREISNIPLPPPPPTPADPQPKGDASATSTVIPLPNPIDPVLIDIPIGDTFPTYPGPGDLTGTGTGTGTVDVGLPGPSPSASVFDPVGARPKGKPSRWVTNDDYRSRWILEEMAGTARFNLTIDTRGEVTDCAITRSTGHAPLDAATCELVTRRARFDAARDGTGKPVAGNYSGVITWQIPK